MKNAEANRRLKARGFGKVAEVYFPEYGCAGRGSRNTKVAIVALYDFSIAKWVTNAVLWDANRRLVEQVEARFPEREGSVEAPSRLRSATETNEKPAG